MSEITRVPLQPIAKGSLTKLWLGIVVALLLAAGFAWSQRYQGVTVETLAPGAGPMPTKDDVVLINYTGKLADGTVFDKGEKVPLPLEGVVPGFSEGLSKMQKGGKYRLFIPASKGYGAEAQRNPSTGQVVIPANSALEFDVELLDFRSRAEIMAQQQMLQQLQQQGGAGAAPPR
ncbi:FKBP-type peptidyl-prolyl cis-trans isomerase [Novosphingobium tardum]|jgi:FKBP-type peptidyl-prolyl cis-trans isomerase FkpA|uniref:Peptidyl-prolyl cis-trans isomerase n=1 Tax=Novosphingobium tardum TaxID=1538021 RepID=A0ABV8RNX0_9SPHN